MTEASDGCKQLQTAPANLIRILKDFTRFPTERNECFVSGYVHALLNTGHLNDSNYWTPLPKQVRDNEVLRSQLRQDIENMERQISEAESSAQPSQHDMKVAKAVLDACEHSASKGRSLGNLNLDAIVVSATRQDVTHSGIEKRSGSRNRP